MATEHHVLIGAGPAGLAAAQTIREIDQGAEITLIGDEAPYSRMAIPYYLAGDIERNCLLTGDAQWFSDKRIKQLNGRVKGIDASNKQVKLADGSPISYDKLLIATGSRAVRPEIPGADCDGVLNMWNLADAQACLSAGARQVTIVGAGFIGLIILDALVKRGARVTFVEIAPQILPRMLDHEAASIVENKLSSKGVRFLNNAAVKRIDRSGKRFRLELSAGDPIECDLVILATGICPNIDFLDGSGVRVDKGILVDDHLRTNVDGIYAAGDVAQGEDLISGEKVVHAIQPTAIDHGRVAGANMAGRQVSYAGSLSMNILDALGVEACSFGLWDKPGQEATTVVNRADGIYRKYIWDGDRMIGAILVGPSLAVSSVNDVGMLRGLIQSRVSIGPWRGYLMENPLDLRRPYLASGAAKVFAESTLLGDNGARGGGFRPLAISPAKEPSPHHRTLMASAKAE